ncbi:hypothetical protein B1748_13615 [Paenibacillus sp. MY03]|uniref:DUF4145 domain-containing protein n=1 Tax=Paenibacillus sp. MY03 TaxID=302980 RepID=UPI000B3C3FA0|nr:DUF4145 domain-containing protein [Paenibacillus sp. MY03]OUS76293.1 hypothetical protein B1748_13615 [Paenibacillus sp. MY03]
MTTQKSPIIAYCSKCQDKKLFSIHGEYLYKGTKKNENDKEYALVSCTNCNNPSLYYREDFFGLGTEIWDYDMCVFPKDERILTYDVPIIVKESYEEALKCEKAKAAIATVVMVRRALEAVCKDFVPGTKTVFDGLKQMKENGFISDDLLDWSEELRFLGNKGAHATEEKITINEAHDSLDFLQSIMEILYHLRPRFKDLKARRENMGVTN